jgi:UDP-glucose 4-epimerase
MKNKILMIGGSGFLGRNFIDALSQDNKITVFDKSEVPNGNFLFVKGDLTNKTDLEKVFGSKKFDVVIYAASTMIPSTSNKDMDGDIKTNLLPLVNVLRLMVECSIPKIIFSSSGGAIYGNVGKQKKSVGESYPPNPLSSYAIVKYASEKYIELYHKLFGLDYLILRISNLFGKYHTSKIQGFINIAMEKAVTGESLTIKGKSVKDYIYASDCAKIVYELINKNIWNETFNIGSGYGYKTTDLLKTIEKIAGKIKTNVSNSERSDVPWVILNVRKLKSFIKYETTPIDEALIETHEWIKNKYEQKS